MKPRSVVFNLYGDYVRYRGGEASLRSLTRLLGHFGVSEDGARITLSRMAREGWLASRREGRGSVYSLTEQGWKLLDEGRERIFQRRAEPWTGAWCLLNYSVPESERAVRDRLRRDLAWLGFGSPGPSTWIAPSTRQRRAEALLEDLGLRDRAYVFTARSRGLEEDRRLVDNAWNLEALSRHYAAFLAASRPELAAFEAARLAGLAWSDDRCFVERVTLVHEYRKFPFTDPDLPRELLPDDWLGREAHAVFGRLYHNLEGAAFAAFDRIAGSPRPVVAAPRLRTMSQQPAARSSA